MSSSPNSNRVAVIISTRNRAKHLEQTLESLAAIERPNVPCELLLVDNGSTDETRSVMDRFGAPWAGQTRSMTEAKPGRARALNAAIAMIDADIVVLTDDDLRFPKNWLGEITAPLLDGKADGVVGGIRLAPHLLRPWMTAEHRIYLASTEHKPPHSDVLVGANMALRRAAFLEAGGFHEELGVGAAGSGEETFLSDVMRAQGKQVVTRLDVEVEHHPDASRLDREAWVKAGQVHGKCNALICLLKRTADRRLLTLRLQRAKLLLEAAKKTEPAGEGASIGLIEAYARYHMIMEYREAAKPGTLAHRLSTEPNAYVAAVERAKAQG